MSLVIMTEDSIICARDKAGKLPILIGKRSDGYCFSFESFAYQKLGYETCHELKAGEITKLTKDGYEGYSMGNRRNEDLYLPLDVLRLSHRLLRGRECRSDAYQNGEIMAEHDMKNGKLPDVDYVCGIPDSGVPHAIGYANRSGIPFARPFYQIYTHMAEKLYASQSVHAKPGSENEADSCSGTDPGQKLLFVDDSIVRGTQMRETVEFLYENGAKEVHMRSACPPIMYGCKYLNFSRSTSEMELIARQIIDENEGVAGLQHIDEYSNSNTERGKLLRDEICRRLQLTSLEFQSLEGTIRAVGKPDCQLCSYCWNGRE